MYTAAGLIGGFVAANGFSLLYALNFRLPLFAIGVSYGLCVLIGGILVRISESRGLVSGPDKHRKQDEQEIEIALRRLDHYIKREGGEK